MTRSRIGSVALVVLVGAAVLVGCGGDGGDDPGKGASADRRAGAVTRGTAVCIRNDSSDTLRIEITQAENDQPEFADTVGTESLPPARTRCMKSDSYTNKGAARARITIASGEVFSVVGFNPPFDPPEIAVNGDGRKPDVGKTTDFKIGKHPIVALREPDVADYVQFRVTIR